MIIPINGLKVSSLNYLEFIVFKVEWGYIFYLNIIGIIYDFVLDYENTKN